MRNYFTKKCVLTLLLLTCSIPLLSQSIISGRVRNEANQTLADISVMLMLPKDSTIIAYSLTNSKGYYKILYNGNSSKLLISISSFNIKQKFKTLENKTQTVDFIAEEGSIELQEVMVKPKKMWGEKDTINYSVAAFKDKKDMVIGDVLKKMPGIAVAESGQISYKGKPINKFYIENLDMLQGRYGIATNNISAEDISTVQVLENHQPIKAFDKLKISDNAAINLKIKEDKKGIFSMMASLGLGLNKKALWNEEFTGMYFSKVRQNMFTYKTNNDGTDLYKELRSFTSSKSIGGLQMTNVQQPSPPSIRFERYNFNNSNAATLSNLFKLKNDAELNANIIFYKNKDNRHSFARTSYVIPSEEIQIVEEDILSQNRTNSIEGEFRYNVNKTNNYFNNYLDISGSWNDAVGDVNSFKYIHQKLDNKSFYVNNITHWIKTKENGRGLEIQLNNSYKTQPHSLHIIPGLYADRFNSGNEYAALSQNIRYNTFVSDNKLSFLAAWMIGKLKINPKANLRIDHQNFGSDMGIMDNNSLYHSLLDEDMRNDISWTRINSGISIEGIYVDENMKISFNLPVIYRYTDMKTRIREEKSLNANKFYFHPSFFIKYNISSRLETKANISFYSETPSLTSLYTGYIMQNYRSMNKYDARIFDTKSFYASLGLDYKNVFEMFFAGGGINYNHMYSDAIYGQIFDGVLSINQLLIQPNRGHSLSVNGRVSKGFEWKNLTVSATTHWGKLYSDHLRQSQLVNYEREWLNANLSVNMKLSTSFLVGYKASWGRSQAKITSEEIFKPMQSLTNRVAIDIVLPLDISLNAAFEHYYNSVVQSNKNFSIVDLGLTYVRNRVRYSLSWTNILNTERYISAYYGALNSYYSEYEIRPMAIMLKIKFKLF